MAKFDIFKYIGSNLEKKIKLEELYNIDLDIDENGEPFLDVSYNCGKNGKKLFVGLRSAIVGLQDSVSVIKSLELPYSIPKKPIITVLYNSNIKKYELEYGSDKEHNFQANERFVIGYVIDPKSSLDFEEKIKLLYEVMVNCIDARGFATVNGSLLTHPIYTKDSFNQVRAMNPCEYGLVNQENINVINDNLKAIMGLQKTKK